MCAFFFAPFVFLKKKITFLWHCHWHWHWHWHNSTMWLLPDGGIPVVLASAICTLNFLAMQIPSLGPLAGPKTKGRIQRRRWRRGRARQIFGIPGGRRGPLWTGAGPHFLAEKKWPLRCVLFCGPARMVMGRYRLVFKVTMTLRVLPIHQGVCASPSAKYARVTRKLRRSSRAVDPVRVHDAVPSFASYL